MFFHNLLPSKLTLSQSPICRKQFKADVNQLILSAYGFAFITFEP